VRAAVEGRAASLSPARRLREAAAATWSAAFAEDHRDLRRGGPARDPGTRQHRRGHRQDHARQVPARACRRHHGPRYHPHRRWCPVARPRWAAARRDRDADPSGRQSAGAGRARHGQMRWGLRCPPAGA